MLQSWGFARESSKQTFLLHRFSYERVYRDGYGFTVLADREKSCRVLATYQMSAHINQ